MLTLPKQPTFAPVDNISFCCNIWKNYKYIQGAPKVCSMIVTGYLSSKNNKLVHSSVMEQFL